MAVDEQIVELIHGEIDGVNSADDSRRLKERIAADAEIRRLHAELTRTAEMIDSLPEVELPPGLAERLESTIPTPQNVAAFTPRKPPGLVRLGYALAAGLAIGLFGYHFLGPDGSTLIDPGSVTGSMLPHEPTIEVALETSDFSGTARAARQGERAWVEVTAEGEAPYEVVLSFDSEAVELVTLGVDADNEFRFTSEAGRLTIRGRGRRQGLVHLQVPGGDPIVVRVDLLQDGKRTLTEELTLR